MKRIIGILVITVMLLSMLTGCGLDVPKPAIKSGEFDFSVTYEINGETKTVSGVYACEYTGLGFYLDGGFSREWEGHVTDASLEEPITIARPEDNATLELRLDFYPDYFMGDASSAKNHEPIPYLAVRYESEDGISFEDGADFIYEEYKARIISYDYEEPIENSFDIFNF